MGIEDFKQMNPSQIADWEHQRNDGVHGILTRPDGQDGFLVKYDNATSWSPIEPGASDADIKAIRASAYKKYNELIPPEE